MNSATFPNIFPQVALLLPQKAMARKIRSSLHHARTDIVEEPAESEAEHKRFVNRWVIPQRP